MQAYELIQKAIGNLVVGEQRDPVDEATVYAAQMGLRYLVEKSCDDNAARGRASRREEEFRSAVGRIDEARDCRNRGMGG